MDTIAVILIIAALLTGLAVGWFLGSRPLAEAKARHDEAEERFKVAIAELGSAQIELATLKANADNFDKQIVAMKEAREDLLAQFKATGGEVLSKAQEQFLKAAAERFGHAENASKEAVKSLLEPVHQRLKSYEEQVASLEAKRVDSFGQLSGLIQSMAEGQKAVRDEAMKLSSALTSASKVRGRWGEQQLKNVLEQCDLSEHTDFFVEQSVDSEEGRLRPDAIVRIPGNKILVIDAKVSLNAYLAAIECTDDELRNKALDEHLKSIKSHVQALGSKAYQSQFDEAPDYVVMFVPGQHYIDAALERDAKRRIRGSQFNEPDLWNFAFERRVLLCGPTNLVAIARTIAQVWRQDELAREAKEIGRIGSELYGRLETAAQHLKRVGGGLETAVNNYNKFVASFERNVLSSGKRLAEKGVEIGKSEIPEVPLVESAPRYTGSDLEEPAPPGLVEGRAKEEADEGG